MHPVCVCVLFNVLFYFLDYLKVEVVGHGAHPDVVPEPDPVGHPAGSGAEHDDQPAPDRLDTGAYTAAVCAAHVMSPRNHSI